jgi:hypothetical protein
VFIRFRNVFPALHLYPSDTVQQYPIPVGMRGLRHKPRHNRSQVGTAILRGISTLSGPRQGSPNAPTDFRLFDLEKIRKWRA